MTWTSVGRVHVFLHRPGPHPHDGFLLSAPGAPLFLVAAKEGRGARQEHVGDDLTGTAEWKPPSKEASAAKGPELPIILVFSSRIINLLGHWRAGPGTGV